MNKTTFKMLLAVGAGMGLALPVTQALAAAGKFEFVAGEVKIKPRAGAEQVARKGMEVNEGDLITSGKPGYAQIRFEDGGIAALQASTALNIDKFVYKQEDKSKDVVNLELLRGRLRAITGEVGSVYKENYTIRTPMAQMGVRGTDHEAIFIPQPVAGEIADGRTGTYNKVNVGGTYIQNQVGRVDVGPAQTGYVADAKSQPALLPGIPSIYLASGGATSKRRYIQVDADGSSAPIVRTINSTDGVPLSPAKLEVAGIAALGATTGTVVPFSTATATRHDTGGNAALGVDWGRWDSAAVPAGGVGSLHYINTSNPTSAGQLAALPGAGVVSGTYTYAGGTAPTNEKGQTGSVVSATAITNFSTQTISGYTLTANTPGRTWNVTGSGSFAQFGSANGIALNGFCGGCASTAATGRASGQFTGAAAQGIISGYGLQSGVNTVSGTMLLTRP
jgi:hypothetical protein